MYWLCMNLDKYIFMSDDPVLSLWYYFTGTQFFDFNACAGDQFYMVNFIQIKHMSAFQYIRHEI